MQCILIVKTNTISAENIISDEIIELTTFCSKEKDALRLRKIISVDPITTNIVSLLAEIVGAIYKDCWQIELFFKAIKQNLKIKCFYGTSKNAVHTQIWIALITYLLYTMISIIANSKKCFTHFMSELPLAIFQRHSIFQWLKPLPKQTSPPSPQLELFANYLGH